MNQANSNSPNHGRRISSDGPWNTYHVQDERLPLRAGQSSPRSSLRVRVWIRPKESKNETVPLIVALPAPWRLGRRGRMRGRAQTPEDIGAEKLARPLVLLATLEKQIAQSDGMSEGV